MQPWKIDYNPRWKAIHRNLLNKYPNHIPVYTDGSVQGNLCGIGVHSEIFNIKSKLRDNTSIYSCELYAIYSAITFASTLPQKFIILTDSLSAVESLKTPHNSKHSLVQKISSYIHDLPSNKIIIHWIPSHVEIPGNEKADRLAKNSLKLNLYTNERSDKKELIKTVKQIHLGNVFKSCNPCQHDTSISFTPSIKTPSFLLLSRRHQVILTRLHLRVTKLTHSHILDRTDPKSCNNCHIQLSLQYIFINCPWYHIPRQKILSSCLTNSLDYSLDNILDGKFPPEDLIQFLRDTDLINSI